MGIGARILEIRDRKGITQQQLSRGSGIAGSYLSRIENGRLEPGPKTLRRIAQALETPISELFDERPSPYGRAAHCAIGVAGNCIMERLDSRKRKLGMPRRKQWSARQLQLLREAAYLIQTANERTLATFDFLFKALLSVSSVQSGVKKRGAQCVAAHSPNSSPHLGPRRRPQG